MGMASLAPRSREQIVDPVIIQVRREGFQQSGSACLRQVHHTERAYPKIQRASARRCENGFLAVTHFPLESYNYFGNTLFQGWCRHALARIFHKPVEEMGGRGVRKLENTELYDDTLYRPERHRL